MLCCSIVGTGYAKVVCVFKDQDALNRVVIYMYLHQLQFIAVVYSGVIKHGANTCTFTVWCKLKRKVYEMNVVSCSTNTTLVMYILSTGGSRRQAVGNATTVRILMLWNKSLNILDSGEVPMHGRRSIQFFPFVQRDRMINKQLLLLLVIG